MNKKIRFSRIDPPTTFSNDEISINIAGMRYQRGFAITRHQWIKFCHEMQQKEVITTTVYHFSKHYKKALCFKMIFGLTGKITSITATMWLDLYTTVKKCLEWEDVLPDELRPIWVYHFEMMQEIRMIKFQ